MALLGKPNHGRFAQLWSTNHSLCFVGQRSDAGLPTAVVTGRSLFTYWIASTPRHLSLEFGAIESLKVTVRRGAWVPDFLRIFPWTWSQGHFLSPLILIIEHMCDRLKNILSQLQALVEASIPRVSTGLSRLSSTRSFVRRTPDARREGAGRSADLRCNVSRMGRVIRPSSRPP